MPYFLMPHIFVRVLGIHVVVLDLRGNDYLAVSNAPGLQYAIAGWPCKEPSAIEDRDSTERAARAWMARGFLTADSDIGKPLLTLEVAPANESYLYQWRETKPKIRVRHVFRLLLAFAQTICIKKWCSMERRVQILQARARRARTLPRKLPPESLRELAGVFLILRPLLYTAFDECLKDSEVAARFLQMGGHDPSVVFGVKLNPFGAHCWVQDQSCVVNDSHVRVSHYEPIMVI
jgi:Transglutaminase-like superfamily